MVPCVCSTLSRRFSTDLMRICVPNHAPPPANAAEMTPMITWSIIKSSPLPVLLHGNAGQNL